MFDQWMLRQANKEGENNVLNLRHGLGNGRWGA